MFRFLMTVVLMFLAVTGLGYVIHAVLLAEDYRAISHLQRPMPQFGALLLANLVFSAAAVWLHNELPVLVTISNVFDTYYYEKKGYPLMGAAFTVKYRVGA